MTLQAVADAFGLRICVLTSYPESAFIAITPASEKSHRCLYLSFWAEVCLTTVTGVLTALRMSLSMVQPLKVSPARLRKQTFVTPPTVAFADPLPVALPQKRAAEVHETAGLEEAAPPVQLGVAGCQLQARPVMWQ